MEDGVEHELGEGASSSGGQEQGGAALSRLGWWLLLLEPQHDAQVPEEETQVGQERDPRWLVALALARCDGRVIRGALASALEVSERAATRVLSAMVDAHVLIDDGSRGRSAGYRLR